MRAVKLGITVQDLDLLTIGLVMDMFTESQNDNFEYDDMAEQADFDKF
nr:MAG TPA: hypothetical protein [Caudoviricetes sp.]